MAEHTQSDSGILYSGPISNPSDCTTSVVRGLYSTAMGLSVKTVLVGFGTVNKLKMLPACSQCGHEGGKAKREILRKDVTLNDHKNVLISAVVPKLREAAPKGGLERRQRRVHNKT